MAFIMTPQGLPSLGAVSDVMDSPTVPVMSIIPTAFVNDYPYFYRTQVITGGIPSQAAYGQPRYQIVLHVEGLAD